jgi:hypothetical protein
MRLLWRFLGFFYRRIPRLRYRLVQMTGQQRDGGRRLTILTTAEELYRDHVAQLTYSDVEETQLGRVWRWNLYRVARNVSADILIVTGVPRSRCRRVRNKAAIFVPRQVLGKIDFDTALKRIETSSQIKTFIRKFRSKKLEYEVTSDPDRVHDFYHNMYVPYVRQRFGATAQVMPLKRIRRNIDRLELALIRQGQAYIAGHLLYHNKKGEVEDWVNGLKDGDPAYLQTGAGAALYYHNILYFADKGFRKLDCGWSCTFLHDGILQHKKLWGMRLVDTQHSGSFLVALNDAPQTKTFFQNNPVIGVSNDKLTGMLFARQGELLSEHELIEAHRKYYVKGMDRLRVLLGGDPGQHPPVPDELKGELTLESADRFFQATLSPAPTTSVSQP